MSHQDQEVVSRRDVDEARVNDSVARLLRQKFALGLFEQRYVDPDAAEEALDDGQHRALGRATQSRSVTVLTNHATAEGSPTLPLARGCRVHAIGVDPAVVAKYAVVVDDQRDADITILRTSAPFEPRDGAFESFFHSGSLAFSPEDLEPLLATPRHGPTVVDVFLERAAVVTPIAELAAALTGTFGCTDEAYLDALFGVVPPEGRLPIALPRSMADVEASPTDVPLRGDGALFPSGTGVRIASRP